MWSGGGGGGSISERREEGRGYEQIGGARVQKDSEQRSGVSLVASSGCSSQLPVTDGSPITKGGDVRSRAGAGSGRMTRALRGTHAPVRVGLKLICVCGRWSERHTGRRARIGRGIRRIHTNRFSSFFILIGQFRGGKI